MLRDPAGECVAHGRAYSLYRHHCTKPGIDVPSAAQDGSDKPRQGDTQQACPDSIKGLYRNQGPRGLPATGDQPAQGQGQEGGKDQCPIPVPRGMPPGPKRHGNQSMSCGWKQRSFLGMRCASEGLPFCLPAQRVRPK